MKLCGTRIVVLGGNGFIGSRLIRMLVQEGACVTSFDRQGSLEQVPEVRYVQGDFFDYDQLTMVTDGCDCIVHAVSTITPGSSQTQYLRGYTDDFAQTARLCDLAWRKGQRMLFLSSGGTVYGRKETPIREDDLKRPINHYGSVKLCIENMMQTFNEQGADFRIARVANPYGPGQDYRKGVGFVDAAIKKTISGETIEIWGDGGIVRDYIYIDDACRMLCDILCHEGRTRIFNVSTGVGISQLDVVDILASLGEMPKVSFFPQRSIDASCIVLDPTRYFSHFSFRPRPFEAGLREYLTWLCEQKTR